MIRPQVRKIIELIKSTKLNEEQAQIIYELMNDRMQSTRETNYIEE